MVTACMRCMQPFPAKKALSGSCNVAMLALEGQLPGQTTSCLPHCAHLWHAATSISVACSNTTCSVDVHAQQAIAASDAQRAYNANAFVMYAFKKMVPVKMTT